MNLFIASELDWPEEGFRLRQETKYPESEQTTSQMAFLHNLKDVENVVRISLFCRFL